MNFKTPNTLKENGFTIDHPTTKEPYLKLGTPNPSIRLFTDETHIYLTGPGYDKLYTPLIALDLADPKVFEKVKHHYHNNPPK